MGGVTKFVSNVGDAVGDVVEDVGDAIGIGGGGGSAAPAPAPAPTTKIDMREAQAKLTGRSPQDYSGQAEANAAARAQVAEGVAAVRPKVDEVMQQVGITPQVVVYGPDGTVYSNPAAAEAAGVTNYTMTPPTFDRVNPLDPVAPGGFASPIDPGVIRPFQPGEGGFFGGATTGISDFVQDKDFYATGTPEYEQQLAEQAARRAQTSPYEAATTFGLSNPAANERFTPTPFQRPEQTGGAPLSPEQAMVFARQAAQRPMQRFAAGGSVRPMQQGVGSLINRMKRG